VPLLKHGLDMHGFSRVAVVVLLINLAVVVDKCVISDEALTDFKERIKK
jgi:hypothetical protein